MTTEVEASDMVGKRSRHTATEDAEEAQAVQTPAEKPAKKQKTAPASVKPKSIKMADRKAEQNLAGADSSEDPDLQGGSEFTTDEPERDELNTEDGSMHGRMDDEHAGHASMADQQQKKVKKVLDQDKLKRLKEDYDRRGVVYIGRIPPHMKPMKLKQLLSQYGEVLRVYCTPEDPRTRKLRKQKGGNTGKNFTEGWVEFRDKRIAKRTALSINGQRIGGKRRSAYYDDLWNIKYLKHFKWDYLTEEIAYQNAVREQKLAAEISAAKRERDHYLAQVDKSKALTAMAERREAKAAQGGGAGAGAQPARKPQAVVQQGAAAATVEGAGVGTGGEERKERMVRRFSQIVPKADPTSHEAPALADDVLMMVARSKKAKWVVA